MTWGDRSAAARGPRNRGAPASDSSEILKLTAGAIGVGLAVRWAMRKSPPTASRPFTYRLNPLERAYAELSVWVDQKIGWPNLPVRLGLAVLIGERYRLRQDNLHDTNTLPTVPQPPPQPSAAGPLTNRSRDGTFNDLHYPAMGSAGTRFGRNVPNEFTMPDPMPDLMTPNPRHVSRELLTRDTFRAARSLNMLAAAWIQFMTRDWFTHGTGDKENAFKIDRPPGDTWWQNPMLIPRTVPDPTRPADAQGAPPTHLNFESHWWDGSQIYPVNPDLQALVRSGVGGKLNLDRLPNGDEILSAEVLRRSAEAPGWWLGLGLMYTLFAREHNAICGRLAAEYPGWSDDELFNRARMINAALMAKIHTVEWTPAIVAHPTTVYALRANWWGVAGERVSKLFGRIGNSEVISGIPGSPTDHHAAPYALTEEFVAVYRMHPLIRDEYSFRRTADDASIVLHTLEEITDRGANQLLRDAATEDLLYSFGTLYPGELSLHNYPKLLQHFRRPDDIVVDLASIDIMRMREFGVPRYALFRELLHLRPIRSFDELTTNPEWARQMREVYDDRIDRLDLMIGMFAEPKPVGFGFSDTAFRIFILMASRRLKSDRFFTADYRPEVYTPAGMAWINNTTMTDILLRHYPGLRPAMRGVTNAFAPWAGSRE
jgi:hypothetical protein